MTINTFVMSGEVKKMDVSVRPAKKGPAVVLVVQNGPSRQRTDQAVQFLNVAVIRVPPYVYEKCKAHLAVGSMVDITGHTQGVLKQTLSEGFIVNELVADRLQVVDVEEEQAEQEDADPQPSPAPAHP